MHITVHIQEEVRIFWSQIQILRVRIPGSYRWNYYIQADDRYVKIRTVGLFIIHTYGGHFNLMK